MSTLELGQKQRGEAGPGPTTPRTGTFDALGHRFSVASQDVRTIALVEEAFSVLAAGGPPGCWYHVRRHADCIELRWRTTTLGVVTDCADVLSLLTCHVQRAAITAADGDLVLPPAEWNSTDRTFVIGGETGCGVSTLVAALVGEGCSYMSDDAIPVEMRSGKVRACPQPILLDDRSLDLLPEITALRSGLNRGAEGDSSRCGRRNRRMHRSLGDVSVVLFPERDDSGITMLNRSITTTPSYASQSMRTTSRRTSRTPSRRSTTWCAAQMRSRSWVATPTRAARAGMDTLAPSRIIAGASSQSGHRMCPDGGKPPV